MPGMKGARGLTAIALAMVVLIVAGCGGSSGLPSVPAGSPLPSETAAPVTGEPLPADETPEPGDSVPPDETVPPEESFSPEVSFSPEESLPPEESPPPEETPPAEETPMPTPAPGVTACSGNVSNRTFFETIAGQVDWDVYCAVLPARWNVDVGDFSLRDGGRMEVSYRGPDGARLTLQEGSFCTEGVSACSPRDKSLGEASFGDRTGGLVTLGPDMGFAVYVDPGQAPSWALTGTGMDQATFVDLAAALHRIELAEP